MNAPQQQTAGPQRLSDTEYQFNLVELIEVIFDSKWLIATTVGVACLLGGTYALFGSPTYQADTLIQVEDNKGDALSGLLGQATDLFNIRSPASAEIEILRSRLVVDQAVANLGLDIEVTPRYLPLIGQWLAKRAKGLSKPGLFGWGGFVSGTESLSASQFDVPASQEGEPFRIRLTTNGYELISPDGDVVGHGQVGKLLEFMVDGETGRILVSKADGAPNAQFFVTRYFRLAVTEQLQKDLKITEEGKQSGVIRATLDGSDPRDVARLLNEIGRLYVRQNTERKAAEAEKSLDFLETFLPELRRQMEAAETKFNQFRNQNSTFDLDAEGKAVLDASVKLHVDLLTLEQKRKELRQLYTAEHFSIRALDAQIAAVNSKLDELNLKVKRLPNTEQQLLSLTRDVKVNSDLYVNLLNSSQQLRLLKEGKVGNVRVVDIAAITKKPIRPQRILVLVMSALLGTIAGLGLAFLRNTLRPGLKDPSDIEQYTGLHVFASVPHSNTQGTHANHVSKRVAGNHVLAVSSPQDPAVESLRSLRTALQFAMLDAPNNVILITGPTPGIGKSFTSVNLAAVLGAADKKVLLVDADMRKGHLCQYFGLSRDRGLSEVVSGSVKFEEAIHRSVAPNLDLLSTGIFPPNPAELLMSPVATELIKYASQHYDLVLIDTPPVLAASDTAILAPHAGAVFLVARAEVTSLGELFESSKRLLDTGVRAKGVIFNGLNLNKRRYTHGLGHKYGGYRYVKYEY